VLVVGVGVGDVERGMVVIGFSRSEWRSASGKTE
jgi:hypothetical protein